MAIIKWRDSYSTGVQQFDDEHHKIVELINDMFEMMRDKNDQAAVEKLLSEVITYTEYHFDNEEKILDERGYPELTQHKKEHEKLKAEVINFKEKLNNDFDNSYRELYKFLREWLTNHILECDMKYSEHLTKS